MIINLRISDACKIASAIFAIQSICAAIDSKIAARLVQRFRMKNTAETAQ